MKPMLFFRILSLEMRTRLSYRLDFWLNAVIGFLAQFGLVYFIWDAMFRESGRAMIGGYEFHQMVVYYLTVIVLGKVVSGREFEGTVSTDIYEGGLNRYMLFPARYFPFKYAQHVGMMLPAAMPFVILGGIALFLLDIPPAQTPTLLTVAMVLPLLVVANLLHFLLTYPIQLVAFWADNVWSLEVTKRFVMTFLGGLMIPLTVFPDWAQSALGVLPFQFFFFFPARVLLGQVSPAEWALGMCIATSLCIFFWLLGRAIWHRGQLQYSGIGI